MAEVTATDIIDSVTDWAAQATLNLWKQEGITGSQAEFAAAVLRVFRVKLASHLAELDAREPGKAALIRERFTAEHEAREA